MVDDELIFTDKYDFIVQYQSMFVKELGRDIMTSDDRDKFNILVLLLRTKTQMVRNRNKKSKNNTKKVYYFSMEFLIGRLLDNYLIDFGIRDLVKSGLRDLGIDLEDILAVEPDPGLGNGGLGRLAACYLDSLASCGFLGDGIGIRFKYGLFKQKIENGHQVEVVDNWLDYSYPWEVKKSKDAVKVKFGGHVERHLEGDNLINSWVGAEEIWAVPYDVPIVGYTGETVNRLRLYSAEPVDEHFDMNTFNEGNYAGASHYRAEVEAISAILYPDDSRPIGKQLRLKQEYFFVAAGLANICSDFKRRHNGEWLKFPEYIALHINDTHPAMCAPELLRILLDEEKQDWNTAWYVVTHSISYTNHTILPESMETWPIDMFQSTLPRVYDIIEEIDRRYQESFPKDIDNWQNAFKNTAILWDGQVRMANLSVIVSSHVNGVAALHTDILKERILKDFYTLMPDKFNNKTNGISHRRFLCEANPSYTKIIRDTIGDGFYKDAFELEKLVNYESDPAFLEKVAKSKMENKQRLAKYIYETSGVKIDPDSVFDVQVKRFHAYKRQLLNVLKVMYLHNKLLNDPTFTMNPTTFIFAGKAAQSYAFAKDVISLVCHVADRVNNDPKVKDRIKVAFIPNFSVSSGQLIYPAADISEQISTAGYEASGTGNMKFMINGAITLGTLDGATVEIAERVGSDNIKIFGLNADRIEQYKREQNYIAEDVYNSNEELKVVVDSLKYSHGGIYNTLLKYNDEYFVLKDFESYVDAFLDLDRWHRDSEKWYKASVHNTAMSGFFSSDRAIKEYAKDIWKL